MTLIIAKIEKNKIAIVSDTKLTHPNHEVKRLQTTPMDGTIKTIIINPEMCVSFSGEIDEAKNAVKKIKPLDSPETILAILKNHHKISEYKTDFLLCIGGNDPIIYEIKNKACQSVPSAWIGDQNAFNRFQASMLSDIKKSSIAHDNNLSINNDQPGIAIHLDLTMNTGAALKIFSKMITAMDEVIKDENINSVGGFRVGVFYEEKFKYNPYTTMYRGNAEFYGTGSFTIGHGSAAEGDYSINFMGESIDYQSLAIHVKQGNFGIVYSRKNNDLFYPTIFEMDEVDFADYITDTYQLVPSLLTEDRYSKFMYDAKLAFHKGNFIKTKTLLEKALAEAAPQQKADTLFHIGITFCKLKDRANAMHFFNEAIKLNSSYQPKIIQILRNPNFYN